MIGHSESIILVYLDVFAWILFLWSLEPLRVIADLTSPFLLCVSWPVNQEEEEKEEEEDIGAHYRKEKD